MSAFLLCAALFLPQFGMTNGGSAEVSANFAVEEAVAGQVVELQLALDISEGWHAYHPDQDPANGIPVSVEISGAGWEIAGEFVSVQEPTLHTVEIGDFKADYLWIHGKPTFTLPIRVPKTTAGASAVTVEFSYQLCDDSSCLAPMTETLTVPLTVSGLTEPKLVEFSTSLGVEEIGAGSTLILKVNADVADGWHLYHPNQDPEQGTPVSVDLVGEGWVAAGNLAASQEPVLHELSVGDFHATYLWLPGKTEFLLPVTVPSAVGATELTVEVTYQLCDDSTCLMVETESFTLALNVTDAAPTVATVFGGVTENNGGGTKLPEGFWPFLLMAISAGAATLLTPCVFPMIPVTISYFTKRSESGKGTPVGNATAYAGGIIFTFAGIGGGAALILGPTGANQIGSNPWVNTAIGLLFIFMAVSLLGYFEIQAPRFLQKFAANTQSGGQSKAGYLPVAMMAVAFSITAFTCTVAFVGAVFAAGLKLGPLYLFGGMFVYGLVFALPFFFLALFPSRLQKMPNAGGWMNTVKVCAGFVEIIAAVKFFSNADLFWDFEILTWPIVLGFSSLVMIAWAAYMFGLFKMPHDFEKPKPGKARFAFAFAILAGGLYLAPGAFNRDFSYAKIIYAFAPPPTYGLPGDLGPAGLTWFEDYDEAFNHAAMEGLPLFVDFTGVTCPNCRLMEHGVFPDDSVKPLLQQYARAELWVDKIKKYADMEVDRFQQASQPFYALIDPRDDSVLGTFPGYNPDPAPFANFLQKGLDNYAANTRLQAN